MLPKLNPKETERDLLVRLLDELLGPAAEQLALDELPEAVVRAETGDYSDNLGKYIIDFPGTNIVAVTENLAEAPGIIESERQDWGKRRRRERIESLVTAMLKAARNATFSTTLKRA